MVNWLYWSQRLTLEVGEWVRECAPPEMKPFSSYWLFKWVYLTSHLRHFLVVSSSQKKSWIPRWVGIQHSFNLPCKDFTWNLISSWFTTYIINFALRFVFVYWQGENRMPPMQQIVISDDESQDKQHPLQAQTTGSLWYNNGSVLSTNRIKFDSSLFFGVWTTAISQSAQVFVERLF